MPRGFVWGAYVDDRGTVWALRVDADLALQPQRGWLGGDADGQAPLPRGWLPRCVVGVEPDGRLHRAIVARIDADLWTGARTDFDIERSDGGISTCTVIRLLAERSPIAAP
jgi:hypothetical protein